ncbi:hypothetical protein [Nonomuraea harbinensis]|uniref:Xanthine dehydrogenase family protein molybdopterin-binding subunit n=1 Tax=Nonomuraea harbinensis TaxID=1286938 RepID=A0ABW1C1T3_9ACTN
MNLVALQGFAPRGVEKGVRVGLDVTFVGVPDAYNPVGVKGVGEIGLVGMAAAIANAVFHATGRRIRSVPITIDDLL